IVDRVLEKDGRNNEALLARALLDIDLDRPDQAIPRLRQVLAQDPSQERFILYQLVVALKRAGQDEEAARTGARLAEVQKLAALLQDSQYRSDDLPLQARAAEALFDAGRDKEAVAVLQAALKRDPHFAAGHRLLATWYDKQGQPDKAAEHRRQAGDSP